MICPYCQKEILTSRKLDHELALPKEGSKLKPEEIRVTIVQYYDCTNCNTEVATRITYNYKLKE